MRTARRDGGIGDSVGESRWGVAPALRGLALALSIGFALPGCSASRDTTGDPGGRSSGPASTAALPEAGAASSMPGPSKPFEGLTWSGEPVPTGALLHDDGTRLWSIRLSGERRVIWRHPRADVAYVAASAGGEELALSVGLDPRHATDPSFSLYRLGPDGSVRQVDIAQGFASIDSPVFLRPPTSARGDPPRLYWLRIGENVDERGRLDTHVMVLTEDGPTEVEIPLRFTESVLDLHGFPGNGTFTFTLFRQNDVPVRAEVLRNDDDLANVTQASMTLWGNNEPRAATDILNGVAWLSPTDYVIPVAQRFHKAGYTLRRYRVGCELYGSHVVYRGRAIDWGYSDLPWHLVPAGPGRILVLAAHDGRALYEGARDSTRWSSVDVSTGRLTRTSLAWEPGGWTWVYPRTGERPRRSPDCGDLTWTWP